MAKTNRANDAAKKKAAKEKKLLVILVVLLVPALGYAYKTMSGLNSSAEPTDGPPVAVSTSAPSTTSSTTPPASTTSASAPVDVASGTPPAPSGTGGSSGLVSAVTPSLDQGQLRTFTLLDSKDPFNSDGPSPTPTGAAGPTSGQGTTSQPSPPKTQPKATPPAQQPKPAKIVVPPPTSAVIAVNGVKALVTAASDFPLTSDPTTNGLFRLVSLTRTTAKIAIVGGSYASGAATLTLHVGQPVTLANTADGTRYTLELFRQGTTVPPPPTNGTTTPSTTTPTTTTPATATASTPTS